MRESADGKSYVLMVNDQSRVRGFKLEEVSGKFKFSGTLVPTLAELVEHANHRGIPDTSQGAYILIGKPARQRATP